MAKLTGGNPEASDDRALRKGGGTGEKPRGRSPLGYIKHRGIEEGAARWVRGNLR